MKGVGEKIIAFTDIYFTEYSKKTKGGNFTLADNHTNFLFNLLDKIVENFSSIGQMMKLSEKENMAYLRNSIYILLRSSLSDVIIACWLLDESDNKIEVNNDIINKKIHELKIDHIRFHVSHLKKMESLNLLGPDEKIHELSAINSQFRYLLQEEIKIDLNYKNLPSSTSIKNMLHERNKNNPVLVNAYNCYFIFSKVEHIGEFTKMILEKSYGENNPMDKYVESSIHAIELVIKSLTSLYFKDEAFLNELKSYEVVKFKP